MSSPQRLHRVRGPAPSGLNRAGVRASGGAGYRRCRAGSRVWCSKRPATPKLCRARACRQRSVLGRYGSAITPLMQQGRHPSGQARRNRRELGRRWQNPGFRRPGPPHRRGHCRGRHPQAARSAKPLPPCASLAWKCSCLPATIAAALKPWRGNSASTPSWPRSCPTRKPRKSSSFRRKASVCRGGRRRYQRRPGLGAGRRRHRHRQRHRRRLGGG